MHDINSSMENFGGSPYLQKKVDNARTVIEEDVLGLRRPPSSPGDLASKSAEGLSSSVDSTTSSSRTQFSTLYDFPLFGPLRGIHAVECPAKFSSLVSSIPHTVTFRSLLFSQIRVNAMVLTTTGIGISLSPSPT